MVTGLTLLSNDGQEPVLAKAATDRYRQLFETASDGILILSADSGVILDANPSLVRLLGQSRADLPGRWLWQVGIFPDSATSDALIQTIQQTSYVRLGNLTIKTPRGLSAQVEFVANSYFEGDENVIQCNIRDITERKGYETELAAANAQSSIILESMTDAFFALDRQWCFTFVNEQAELIMLRSADDLIGQNLWEAFPQAIGLTSEREFRRAMQEQVVVEFEEYFAPLRSWFEVHAFPSDAGLSIYFNDITVRKKAEKALQESADRLRLSTDGAGYGLWQYLIATRDVNFTPRGFELYGLPTDGSVPITREVMLRIMHPDDIGPVFAALERSKSEACDFIVDYRILLPDAKVRWIHSHGKPYLGDSGAVEWIQGVMSDITPQKVAEAERDAADLSNEHIVETLQRSLIQMVPPGRFPGLEIEQLYVPGANEAEIGGDFFDTFALTDTKVAFVVGDVLGKGLDAVGRTSEVKYALRALLHEHLEPNVALARLNDFLYTTYRLDESNTGTFVVVAVVVVDTAEGTATVSAAGAEPTLILRADGSTEIVETGAVPLGIQPDSQYLSENRHLAPGDVIVMLSDGITGARRGTDEFLGLNGVIRLFERIGSEASLEQMSQDVYQGAIEFGGGFLRDDACLLFVRRTA